MHSGIAGGVESLFDDQKLINGVQPPKHHCSLQFITLSVWMKCTLVLQPLATISRCSAPGQVVAKSCKRTSWRKSLYGLMRVCSAFESQYKWQLGRRVAADSREWNSCRKSCATCSDSSFLSLQFRARQQCIHSISTALLAGAWSGERRQDNTDQ